MDLARIGILHLGFQELFTKEEFTKNEILEKLISRSHAWIKNILNNHPSVHRPLIDLNHLELFVIWVILYQRGDNDTLVEWLSELEGRLTIRRMGHYKIPFIEGRNRYDLIAEYAATYSQTKEKPPDFTDTSSYLLLMLFEIMFSLDEVNRNELLNRYYKHLILGIGDDDKPLSDPSYEVDLYSWCPPEDWHRRIYREKVTNGIALSTQNFHSQEDLGLDEKIKSFIKWSEEKYPNKLIFNNPLSTYLLACIKNLSPLPPIFWRGSLFKDIINKKEEKTELQ